MRLAASRASALVRAAGCPVWKAHGDSSCGRVHTPWGRVGVVNVENIEHSAMWRYSLAGQVRG